MLSFTDLIIVLCNMDGDMEFSNNPADYNRVVCMACGAKVKVKSLALLILQR